MGGSAGGTVGGATSASVPGSNGIRPDASFSTTLPSSLQGHSSNSSLGQCISHFSFVICQSAVPFFPILNISIYPTPLPSNNSSQVIPTHR